MTRLFSAAVAAAALMALLTGCSAPSSSNPTASTAPSATAATATPASATEPSPTASASPALTARIDAPAVVVEGGEGVFAVDGVLVVSKQHPLSRSYVPPWSTERNGLHPHASAALASLIADAKTVGLTLKLRSGYRSYADQGASFSRQLRLYPEATARLYYAEAGKSEHQTGLAVDLWDGVRRGSAFTRTPQAAWLAAHAWEYGFIVRYPEGRTDVTGYAYESWHLRYVGTEISTRFGPNSTLTLEEFLSLR